jgi:hypothetical protein
MNVTLALDVLFTHFNVYLYAVHAYVCIHINQICDCTNALTDKFVTEQNALLLNEKFEMSHNQESV